MQTFFQSKYKPILTLLVGTLCFYIGLGQFHLFDWDEINFAECSREMIETGDYLRVQINYIPFWEKPPFFFWLQVIGMKVFGIGEYASRFPNALFGTLTILSLFWIGKRHYSAKFGFLWALLYMGGLLPHFYFKSGIIDPVFNFWIFWSVYAFTQNINSIGNKWKWALVAGFANGLAVLTKGPVGFLLFGLTVGVFILIKKFKPFPRIIDILVFAATLVAVIMSWWAWDIKENGFAILNEFIDYQVRLFSTPDAGHKQPWFYHLIVVFFGCFPFSVVALPSFGFKDNSPQKLKTWMLILFWVVMILFSYVETKIVHYSSMCYLPLSFLAAIYVHKLIEEKEKIKGFIKWFYLVVGSLISVAVTVLPILCMEQNILQDLLSKDKFGQASFGLKEVEWGGYEFIFGIVLLATVIFSFINLSKKNFLKAFTIQAAGLAITFVGLGIAVLPKIEQYTQGPAIEFYESVQDKDAYIYTLGYKSYGVHFYSRSKPNSNPKKLGRGEYENWLLNGDIDKPAYFSAKITHHGHDNHPNLDSLYTKGGFKFFVRYPKKN